MADLLNVDTALEQILAGIAPLDAETLALHNALGRVLAADIVADVNIPPFPNSSMDGYAVRAADVAQVPTALQLVMDIPAGSAPATPLLAGQAARIMTGAPLPAGADAIIPVENTDTRFVPGEESALPSQVTVLKTSKAGDYVRPVGEDFHAGHRLLAAGRVLRPQDIGVLAALGRALVPVIRQPRIVVLSSGDELLDAHEPLTPGKIHDVNGYTLAASVAQLGAIPLRLPTASDMLEAIRALFHAALAQQPNAIISSAGVSVGSFDLVRTVLAELGQVNFWKINLRPGKPLAFGMLQGVPFFGLPGNPVSALVTFDVLVRPALLKMSGKPVSTPTALAVVAEPLRSDGRRSYLRVTLERQGEKLVARSTGTQSSGALMSMVRADGLLIIPEDIYEVAAGTELRVRLFKSLEEIV
ncbi:MAG: molybdopterin molybdotransferase MoeA [Chloroflexi bacterium]|nr:molybdopterin molybdotransferase MoeA [Chloroflexota bacterium]